MTNPQTDQFLNAALQHHQAGRLREAEHFYRQVLQADPANAFAAHNLGVLAGLAGNYPAGIELIRRAIALKPDWPEARANLGKMLTDAGQPDAGAEACRQAIAIRPDCAEAHNNLGVIFRMQGHLVQAIAAARQAIAARPNYPEAYTNLSASLKAQGHVDQAIAAARQAIALRPSYAEAYNNLGLALQASGQLADAIDAFRQALQLAPRLAEAHNNLASALIVTGRPDQAILSARAALALRPRFAQAFLNLSVALKEKKEWNDAISACRQAVAINPQYAEAWNNLGILLTEQDQLDEAIAALKKSINLRPRFAPSHHNLSVAYRANGEFDAALASASAALDIDPNFDKAHYDSAVVHLLRGELSQGWVEYEWRSKIITPPSPDFPQSRWDGSPLAGRTILLHAEQGLGDTIQFVRYAPLVAARGHVVIQCQPPLKKLLQLGIPSCQIISQNDPLPAFDVHCPIMSLPLIFSTDLLNIPQSAPYLHPDPQQSLQWKNRLAELSPHPKIGLAWRGNPHNQLDSKRSIPLSQFASFSNIPNITFISLQKDAPPEEMQNPSFPLIDWTCELTDFADTAALIANLDLVISVDTAVAHLAGALAKPVWTLLPASPDWRWLLNRADSPWYPRMRLFRQTTRGNWNGVITEVAKELSHPRTND